MFYIYKTLVALFLVLASIRIHDHCDRANSVCYSYFISCLPEKNSDIFELSNNEFKFLKFYAYQTCRECFTNDSRSIYIVSSHVGFFGCGKIFITTKEIRIWNLPKVSTFCHIRKSHPSGSFAFHIFLPRYKNMHVFLTKILTSITGGTCRKIFINKILLPSSGSFIFLQGLQARKGISYDNIDGDN